MRQKNLDGARAILGRAIGVVHTDKIFKGYIELELQLGNMDRCRIIYEKCEHNHACTQAIKCAHHGAHACRHGSTRSHIRYLEHAPANCFAWSKFAELEKSLGEVAFLLLSITF